MACRRSVRVSGKGMKEAGVKAEGEEGDGAGAAGAAAAAAAAVLRALGCQGCTGCCGSRGEVINSTMAVLRAPLESRNAQRMFAERWEMGVSAGELQGFRAQEVREVTDKGMEGM